MNHRLLMLTIIYIKDLINRTFNDTGNIYKHIKQYSTDSFYNYKINKTHNVKKANFKYTNDVVIDKHNTINTNDTYNVIKMNKHVNFNDKQLFLQRNRT